MVQQYLDHAKEILTSERSNFKGGSKGAGIISLFGLFTLVCFYWFIFSLTTQFLITMNKLYEWEL